MQKNKTPILTTVEKAMSVIDLVAEARRPLTASEVSQRSGMPISTAFKFLSTAVNLGYLYYYESDKTYSLGVKFIRYASIATETRSLIGTAYPLMRELADKCLETVHLGVPQGYYGVFFEKVSSPQVIGVQTRIGSSAPFHKGATQRAMMAWLSNEKFEDFCNNYLLPKEGPEAVAKARADRVETRKNGYAISCGEVNDNVAAVAAPILGANDQLLGSLAIALPQERLTKDKEELFRQYIMDTAHRLSLQLGYNR